MLAKAPRTATPVAIDGTRSSPRDPPSDQTAARNNLSRPHLWLSPRGL